MIAHPRQAAVKWPDADMVRTVLELEGKVREGAHPVWMAESGTVRDGVGAGA